MHTERYLKGLLISTLLAGLVPNSARAQEAPVPAAGNRNVTVGAIVGIIKDAAKSPVGGVIVTSARADGTGLRATVSGSDGIYSFADVVPGEYTVSSQSDGYPDGVISKIEVVAGRAVRSDIVLGRDVFDQPSAVSS